MVRSRGAHAAAKLPLATFIALSTASMAAFPQTATPPQNQSPASSKPASHQSVDVVEHLTPEEAAEGTLNDSYQAVAQMQRKGNCTPEIIQRYESEVIPFAEKSTFDVPRNKFLFLANRDIANCYLAQQKFVEAEASFKKLLQYAPIWPGTDDSAYPTNFRQIATAQMGQQQWAAAEQSLLKSIALFESTITAGEKRDAESHVQLSLNDRGSQSLNYALLGVVYLREGLIQDALNTVEKAYDEVMKYNLAAQYRTDIESIGDLSPTRAETLPPRSFGLSAAPPSDPAEDNPGLTRNTSVCAPRWPEVRMEEMSTARSTCKAAPSGYSPPDQAKLTLFLRPVSPARSSNRNTATRSSPRLRRLMIITMPWCGWAALPDAESRPGCT